MRLAAKAWLYATDRPRKHRPKSQAMPGIKCQACQDLGYVEDARAPGTLMACQVRFCRAGRDVRQNVGRAMRFASDPTLGQGLTDSGLSSPITARGKLGHDQAEAVRARMERQHQSRTEAVDFDAHLRLAHGLSLPVASGRSGHDPDFRPMADRATWREWADRGTDGEGVSSSLALALDRCDRCTARGAQLAGATVARLDRINTARALDGKDPIGRPVPGAWACLVRDPQAVYDRCKLALAGEDDPDRRERLITRMAKAVAVLARREADASATDGRPDPSATGGRTEADAGADALRAARRRALTEADRARTADRRAALADLAHRVKADSPAEADAKAFDDSEAVARNLDMEVARGVFAFVAWAVQA